MTDENLINDCLKNTFGFDKFKIPQKEIILNILNRKNSFVIMPTSQSMNI